MHFLDTCICIDFLRGRLPHGYREMRDAKPGEFKLPAIVVAELWYGAEHSSNPERELGVLGQAQLALGKLDPAFQEGEGQRGARCADMCSGRLAAPALDEDGPCAHVWATDNRGSGLQWACAIGADERIRGDPPAAVPALGHQGYLHALGRVGVGVPARDGWTVRRRVTSAGCRPILSERCRRHRARRR